MCGIAGFFARADGQVDQALLKRMVDSVSHRGPDGEGTFVDGAIGLGHRRLAIIDLSGAGAQPMRRAQSRTVLTYNGEIYNYLELRTELLAKGHCFVSNTDTEVILAAYDEWGPACVRRFNGMWAFALYDQKRKLVFCSRDRFGVKPFYYLDDPRFLAFGSEIRQLTPLLARCVASHEVLLDYLGFATSAPIDRTFFDRIRTLPPAHNLFYRVDTGRYSIERYYRVLERQAPRTMSAAEAKFALRDLLVDAVRLRLRSDVRVGTCLSGGLDSSSIASVASALAREGTGPRFAAITAVSESAANDESAYARTVVDNARLDWHTTRPGFDEFTDALADVVRAQEEPFASPSICMQFFVMREAKRQRIPVLLDGQGGDETLLGYERYVVPALKEFARRGLGSALQSMRSLSRNNAKLRLGSQLLFLSYFSFPSLRWGMYRLRARSGAWLPSLGHFRRHYGQMPATMFDVQRQLLETDSIPQLLRYEDKNSMWHSVETRLPFLDYRLVEFALGLATNIKIRDGWTKHVLREAMDDQLPASITWRKDKVGFEAPDEIWLPKLRSAMLAAVSKSELLKDICGTALGRGYWSELPPPILWRFYVADMWMREFNITGFTERGDAALAS